MSRRQAIGGLGAAAVAGLPGCGGTNGGAVGSSSAKTTAPPPAAKISDGYTDQQSYRPGDRVIAYLNGSSSTSLMNADGSSSQAGFVLTDMTGGTVFEFTGKISQQSAEGSDPYQTGFGYQPTVEFTLPDLASGVYLINGVVPVVVKAASTESTAEIVILIPTNTVAAYNFAGGKSMYLQGQTIETGIAPSPIVSFFRPVIAPAGSYTQTFYYYPLLQLLAAKPLSYSVRFISDIDMDDETELYGAKVLMIIGHSEYWTRVARENFDSFVAQGGNALLLSGNIMWWQVRYSEDRSQMICYKSLADPIADPLQKTINWPDPSLQYPVAPSIGADFPHGGYGTKYPDMGWRGYRILTSNHAILSGVNIAVGDVLSIPTVEYDGAPITNNPLTVGVPQLDNAALGAYKAEILGYDYCLSGPNGVNQVATWMALQRTQTSGVILNGASTDWCSSNGVGGADGAVVEQIIRNMVDALINNQSVFTA